MLHGDLGTHRELHDFLTVIGDWIADLHAGNNDRRKPVLALIGPTATGKTQLGLDFANLASEIKSDTGVEIQLISMDSIQVYRELEIGSAKPSFPARKRFSLMDYVAPDQPYSVAKFVEDAGVEIDIAIKNNKLPLVVGGSMMYCQALFRGLSPLPPRDDVIRSEITTELATKGYRVMLEELHRVDPLLAARLAKNDSQRLIRGLEVFRLAGKPLSAMHHLDSDKNGLGCVNSQYAVIAVALNLDKELVNRQIAIRLEQMLAAGLVNEVTELSEKYKYSLDAPAFRSVGYKQVLDMLSGRISERELFDKILIATRQLAKKQRTWLNQWPEVFELKTENYIERVGKLVRIVGQAVKSNAST